MKYFSKVLDLARHDKRVSNAGFRLLHGLTRKMKADKVVRCMPQELATASGLSQDAASICADRLVDLGYIEITRRGRGDPISVKIHNPKFRPARLDNNRKHTLEAAE